MKVSLSWVLGFMFILLFDPTVFASNQTEYPFDEVEVIHAAEFTAYPTSGDVNAWATELAGGENRPIQILYGVVELKNDGVIALREEFIKVTGENGSERFLLNSVSTVYDEMSNQPRNSTSLFWSGKKLDGSTVVKDYSNPLKTITMHREFHNNGEARDISLSFGMISPEDVMYDSFERKYVADMDTFRYAGDLFVKKSFGSVAAQGIVPLSDGNQPNFADPMDWIENAIIRALAEMFDTIDVNDDKYADLFDIVSAVKQKPTEANRVKAYYGVFH